MAKVKAVFIDRDGVMNEFICYPELGIIDSPSTKAQFRLIPGVSGVINRPHKMGYKAILVSNQPGIANGNLSEETFEEIRNIMKDELAKGKAFLDGEYYCFRHPEAKTERLKANCSCSKPKPGLLAKAAQDMEIDL